MEGLIFGILRYISLHTSLFFVAATSSNFLLQLTNRPITAYIRPFMISFSVSFIRIFLERIYEML